jgi:hypothetical protein
MIFSTLKIEAIFLLIVVAVLNGFIGHAIQEMFFVSSAINSYSNFSMTSNGFLIGFFLPVVFASFSHLSKIQNYRI